MKTRVSLKYFVSYCRLVIKKTCDVVNANRPYIKGNEKWLEKLSNCLNRKLRAMKD